MLTLKLVLLVVSKMIDGVEPAIVIT